MKKQRKESHSHDHARTLMIRWLRRAAKRAGYDKDATFGPLDWRVNRPARRWGVFPEYPLIECMGNGYVPPWDEYGTWPEKAPEIIKEGIVPTYEELILANIRPLAIVDIAIQHKGMIRHVIEIVHKSDLPREKIALLCDRFRLKVWRVDAAWVLDQRDEPRKFPKEKFQRVASFKQMIEEILNDWRNVGRPDNGPLWERVAAAMVLTIGPEEREKFHTLPAMTQKNILRIRAGGR